MNRGSGEYLGRIALQLQASMRPRFMNRGSHELGHRLGLEHDRLQ